MAFQNYSTAKYEPFAPLDHTKVSVICNFAKNGKIHPIYFRAELSDGSSSNFKITKVLSEKHNGNHIVYNCEYEDESSRKFLKLYFQVENMVWSYKKLYQRL